MLDMGCGASKSVSQNPSNDGQGANSKMVPSNIASSISQRDTAVEKEARADVQEADVEIGNKIDHNTKITTKSNQLTLLHFNDVYNIEPREKEPVGGAARFATKLASFKRLNPLVVFSGDCLNPSMSKYVNELYGPSILIEAYVITFDPCMYIRKKVKLTIYHCIFDFKKLGFPSLSCLLLN